ncbi:hypothetical protein F4804DRAFT_326940 [Jackrogersella minutella]|nr:hypothetical protein F4804DRAFT_326940 [Jackrogersella minutella]
MCRFPYYGHEVVHDGLFALLEYDPESMEFVDAPNSELPPGRTPVFTGHEDGKALYPAIAEIDGVWVPGKARPEFKGALVPFADKENHCSVCKILCWRC